MSFLTNVSGLSGNDIPDSGDLHARYDATELTANDGDSISTWDDETGNGYDLTAGKAGTFQTSVINGNPVVRFDGADDFLNVAFTTIDQPYTIFAVAQKRGTSSNNEVLFDSEATTNSGILKGQINNNMFIYAGSFLEDGAEDTEQTIWSAHFDSTNSILRDNGTEYTGDVGTGGLQGFTVGAKGDAAEFGDYDVGEILIYPVDKSGIIADVESYLSDKWGIAI